MTTELPIAETSRTCGACSACCYVLGVERIGKPGWQACSLHKKGKGCTVHGKEERPLECSTYECLWLAGLGERRDRPDRSGLIFDVPDSILTNPLYQGIRTMICREAVPGAIESKRGQQLLSRLRENNTVVLLVAQGKQRRMSGKQELVAELLRRLQASMAPAAEEGEKVVDATAASSLEDSPPV